MIGKLYAEGGGGIGREGYGEDGWTGGDVSLEDWALIMIGC